MSTSSWWTQAVGEHGHVRILSPLKHYILSYKDLYCHSVTDIGRFSSVIHPLIERMEIYMLLVEILFELINNFLEAWKNTSVLEL